MRDSLPHSDKAPTSTQAGRVSLPTSDRVAFTPVDCAIKVGSHRFAFTAQFFDFTDASGRSDGSASGAVSPFSGSARAHVSDLHHGKVL